MLRNLVLIFIVMVAGCATPLSQKDCEQTDWKAKGRADGIKGVYFDRLAQYEKQCGEFSIEINRQAYISGHQYGLTLYCTYENGMRLGRQGETLNRVCERTNFQDFKKGHSTGYEVYLVNERAREEIEDAQEQARDEMEDAQEQARHDIRRAQQQARDDIERSHEETLRAMKQCTFDSDCGPNMRCDSEYKTIGSASGHVNICKSKRF